ncbi:VOC family protein [Novosphingobium sp.]|uniref:VOC family protein n=1 Tax=Novosphingobium sp. TaxID=1874826 RepID=UPI0035694856
MTDALAMVPGLYQAAFVVPDLNVAMESWTSRTKAGPWFIMREFAGIDQKINGVPDTSTSTIALGQLGSMQIELIEVGPNSPKLYQEHVEQHGFGLHHFGLLTADFDIEMSDRLHKGETAVFTARTPSGGRVAHMLDRSASPELVELIEIDHGLHAFFGAIRDASVGWRGDDPWREVPSPEGQH